jgi:protein-tyrosine-phosphatase
VTRPLDDVDPPGFLQAVGHPLRWQLLVELGRSDRSVRELVVVVGEPQNLVSYHLGKLREVGLVSARKSSADGRDAYYAADLARLGSSLSATGAALHPGLALASEPPAAGPSEAAGSPARVLFLCTGNSARSQIAEALLSVRSGGRVEARSAGSAPKPLRPEAVRVVREQVDLDISAWAPKHLEVFADERFDRVITLCDRVKEVCPEWPGAPETAHWSIPDPAAEPSGVGAFRAVAAELDLRIGFLLALLAADRPSLEEDP